jgi:hypothetical protein
MTSTGKSNWGCLKMLMERLRGWTEGMNHVAEGTALMQKDDFNVSPTQELLPSHTPQSSTTLPL